MANTLFNLTLLKTSAFTAQSPSLFTRGPARRYKTGLYIGYTLKRIHLFAARRKHAKRDDDDDDDDDAADDGDGDTAVQHSGQ